jgi:two-component system response regulator
MTLDKGSHKIQRVPIIMFSVSKDPKDIAKAYELGASAFISKPAAFNGLKQILTAFQGFWTEGHGPHE